MVASVIALLTLHRLSHFRSNFPLLIRTPLLDRCLIRWPLLSVSVYPLVVIGFLRYVDLRFPVIKWLEGE